jgi:hypothetical protein
MTARRKLALLLLAALAFGAAMAAVKGQATGARDAIGNLSAPWVVLPFVAGAQCKRLRVAVLAGVAVTEVALLGFYLAEAAVLDLGPHPWYVDVRLALGTFNIYEQWGLLSGALYGVLGALWVTRRVRAAPIAVALAFVIEPLIVAVTTRANLWGGGGLLERPWLWSAEIAIGLALGVVTLTRSRRRPA